MFKDLSGVVNGKTALGVILGLLVGASLAFTNIAELLPFIPPEIVKTIMISLPTFLALFGIWDSSQDSFNDIKLQLKQFFASSPALGLVLNIVIQTIDKLPLIGVPDWIETGGVIVGGLLVTFGLKGQLVNARENLSMPSRAFAKKYKRIDPEDNTTS